MKNKKNIFIIILKMLLTILILTLIVLDFCNINNTSLSTSNIILLIVLIIVVFVDNFEVLQIGKFLKIKKSKKELYDENEYLKNQVYKITKTINKQNIKLNPIIREISSYEKDDTLNKMLKQKSKLNLKILKTFIKIKSLKNLSILPNAKIEFFNENKSYFNFYIYNNTNNIFIDILPNIEISNSLFLDILKKLYLITKYNNNKNNISKYTIITQKSDKNRKNILILSNFFKIFINKQILEFSII